MRPAVKLGSTWQLLGRWVCLWLRVGGCVEWQPKGKPPISGFPIWRQAHVSSKLRLNPERKTKSPKGRSLCHFCLLHIDFQGRQTNQSLKLCRTVRKLWLKGSPVQALASKTFSPSKQRPDTCFANECFPSLQSLTGGAKQTREGIW